MSHAAGFAGTPSEGQCSSAETSASCASSSAVPTSRTMRATTATILADSIRQTAEIVSWVAECIGSSGVRRRGVRVHVDQLPDVPVGVDKAVAVHEAMVLRLAVRAPAGSHRLLHELVHLGPVLA